LEPLAKFKGKSKERHGFSRCYSIFVSGVYRIHAVKWLFSQEKATFQAAQM
jgi:hypothetical protein